LKGGFAMYTEKERREDFNYFIKHYQELYNKYGHKFIAIKNSKILGVFDTEIEAITDVSKEYPLGTFIVQECNGNESGYTNYISSWQLVSI
jgi:hypothetical protein